MRFLVAHPGPHFSVADVYAGWVEALRATGQHVTEFNLQDRLTFYGTVTMECGEGQFKRALTAEQATELAVNGLYAALMRVRPHVLLVISAFFLPTELYDIARAAGVRVVVVHTESPYEDQRQLEVAAHADLNLVNDPTNINAFRALAPTEYVFHCYRPSIHYPGEPEPDLACDVVFVGTGFPSRMRWFEALDRTGYDLALAGNWQALDSGSLLLSLLAHDPEDCLDNADAARLYRSAKVGLNLYRREAQAVDLVAGWAMGPREVEMAACGLFFLRDPRPEGDDLLPLPTFTSPSEAADLIRWYLRHDSERQALADKARGAVADRTFDTHVAALMRRLEGM